MPCVCHQSYVLVWLTDCKCLVLLIVIVQPQRQYHKSLKWNVKYKVFHWKMFIRWISRMFALGRKGVKVLITCLLLSAALCVAPLQSLSQHCFCIAVSMQPKILIIFASLVLTKVRLYKYMVELNFRSMNTFKICLGWLWYSVEKLFGCIKTNGCEGQNDRIGK